MANSTGKRYYSVLVLILIAIAFALGYYTFAWRHKTDETKKQNVPTTDTLALQAVSAKGENVAFTREYIGYVVPIHEAQIQPFINGFINKIYVKGGQYVKQGDVLIILQQDQYLAELAAAEADILKAQAAFKNAEVYYNRIQKAGKSISPTELDNAEAQYLSAAAALEQAKANYALAQVNYGYTIIRSPIDGIAGDIALTPGNYVSPASGALLSIIQYNPIRVVFSITDKEYLQEIEKTHPFADDEIYLRLAGGKTFTNRGIFRYTDNAINRSTNSIAVYADFANIGKTLAPNAYVGVMVKKTFKNALRIPQDLVLLEETGSYTYIARNDVLMKIKVKILASENTDFIIANTFENNDFLITEPVKSSYLGQKIRIIQPGANQNAKESKAESRENV